MNKNLKINVSITINANIKKVWDALTNPMVIKEYLFGTETITDWEVGGPIIFQGEWEGKSYKDKGNIIALEQNKLIQYTYWSGFSGLEDKPENYSMVTYKLEESENQTILTLQQVGFSNEHAQKHSETNWTAVLNKIKQIVENK